MKRIEGSNPPEEGALSELLIKSSRQIARGIGACVMALAFGAASVLEWKNPPRMFLIACIWLILAAHELESCIPGFLGARRGIRQLLGRNSRMLRMRYLLENAPATFWGTCVGVMVGIFIALFLMLQ